MKISSIFVAFLENTNFKIQQKKCMCRLFSANFFPQKKQIEIVVDKETIQLLKLCKSLHKPKKAPQEVFFGENDGKLKTLILDMDETMLHAKFISDQADLANDDGNFVFTL